MKENDVVCLVQAFFASKMAYVSPYAVMGESECQNLDALLHNTLEELMEVHLTAQK